MSGGGETSRALCPSSVAITEATEATIQKSLVSSLSSHLKGCWGSGLAGLCLGCGHVAWGHPWLWHQPLWLLGSDQLPHLHPGQGLGLQMWVGH